MAVGGRRRDGGCLRDGGRIRRCGGRAAAAAADDVRARPTKRPHGLGERRRRPDTPPVSRHQLGHVHAQRRQHARDSLWVPRQVRRGPPRRWRSGMSTSRLPGAAAHVRTGGRPFYVRRDHRRQRESLHGPVSGQPSVRWRRRGRRAGVLLRLLCRSHAGGAPAVPFRGRGCGRLAVALRACVIFDRRRPGDRHLRRAASEGRVQLFGLGDVRRVLVSFVRGGWWCAAVVR